MQSLLVVAGGLFLATHIDTLLVISAFCADNDYRIWEVFVGHIVGFTIGLVAAVGGAVLAAAYLESWTFLLGLIPFSIGLWGLLQRPPEEIVDETAAVPNSVGRIGVVAVMGIGLSGENIAVFIPFFATLESAELLLITVLYLLSAGGIFLLAIGVVHYVASDGISDRLDRWLVPTVLMVIGGYVFFTGLLVG